MFLQSILSLIQPSDKLIYDRFQGQVELLNKMVSLLNKMIGSQEVKELQELTIQIRTHYFESLDWYRKNTAHLAKTFITPIDRESVHELYIKLHSSCRGIYLTSRSFSWMPASIKDKHLVHMGQLLLKGADELNRLVHSIGTTEKQDVMKHAIQMHTLRREMDLAYEQALQKLYEGENNPANFIRRQEMLSALRDAAETCQEIAHTGENIVLTHIG